jgi:hypothetical protein
MSFGGQEEQRGHLSMSPDGRILVWAVIRLLLLELNETLTTCDADDEDGNLVVL